MYNVLKKKKINKILIQRFIRYYKNHNPNILKIRKYFLKNKKINNINRFFYFLKNKTQWEEEKNYFLKKPLKNICPYTGKTFINKKIGFSRFYIQNLLSSGKFNLFRAY